MKTDKTILLFAVSILLIAVFFLLPQNSSWGQQTLLGYWRDFERQKNRTGIEQRKVRRYGNGYVLSRSIASYFIKNGKEDSALVLLPSPAYFRKYGMDYPVPEPAVFYYYCGLRTTWANSPMAMHANWYVHTDGKSLLVDRITSRQMLVDTLNSFLKFPYPL